MTQRLKVLVSAYACSPYKGSEPGVGWGFVAALARHYELWVIVEEEKFRGDIERYLAENPSFSESVHFFYVRKQRNRWLRKLWPPSYYWYYRRWHEAAFSLAHSLHRQVRFDLAHQLTMVGFREPGYLWKLGIPFVWGPVGGMGLFPWRFLSQVGVYGALYYLGYNVLNLWHMHFLRRPRLAAKAAGVGLIAATPENQREAEKYWQSPSTLISEVGLPPVAWREPEMRKQGEPLRIVWTGLHIPGKALNLGLRALALLRPDVSWELHVLGEGKCTAAWQELSSQLGLAEHCHFHGWLPRETALTTMSSGHLLLITSLRDLTSTVTIEALALGMPIVCLDHCGFAGVVDETCGIKVAVTRPADTVRGLAEAIERLGRDEGLRRRLALGAVRRSPDFAWDNKVALLERIYCEVISEKRSIAP